MITADMVIVSLKQPSTAALNVNRNSLSGAILFSNIFRSLEMKKPTKAQIQAAMREAYPNGLPPGSMNEQIANARKRKPLSRKARTK